MLTFDRVNRPSTSDDGLYASGIRFGDPRAMAVLASLVSFAHLIDGFRNRQLAERVCSLMDAAYSSRQATYDLRRLKRKALIEKIPKTRRYHLTPLGRRVAVLFTKTYGRVLAPGLIALDVGVPEPIASRCPLSVAWRRFDRTLSEFFDKQLIAA